MVRGILLSGVLLAVWCSMAATGLAQIAPVPGVLAETSRAMADRQMPSVTGDSHVDEAIMHAAEAVKHGEMGHADAIVSHAEEALVHANMAQTEDANPHLDEGVKALEEAIEHGKQGHADVATEHAKSAVMHLKEIH